MEKSKKRPSAEELLRKIQELEARHAHIKQEIISKLESCNSNSRLRRRPKLTEAQYLNITQSVGQAIHVFDLKYRIRFWSKTAEEIYGFTAAQVYGKTPTEILVDPKDTVLADYLLERTVNGEAWSGEFPVTNNRGETFVVVCTNTPFRDQNGRLIGGICVSSDSRPYQSMKPTTRTIENKHKILLSKAAEWKGNDASLFSKLCYFGWQRLYANLEEGKMKSASDVCNDAIVKVETELDDEILWEDLIIKQQIGQGSCGTVYHGLWHGSDVAIKVFEYQGEYSDDVMVSFKQEVSLMRRLRHPNILLFMGAVNCSPQRLCIVTEFLPRGSLFLTLERCSTRLDWRRRIRMAIDIARGMNYLHLCNPPIVHRDLKSSNLLVDKNWTVKVGDFGLSRIKHQTYLKTKSGKGTPQWMAPEIIRNEQANENYGVVLWEIATTKVPWDDLSPMQVIAAVGFMNRKLEIPTNVDPLWASLIQSCCHSEPQSRPTFQEILSKLNDLQNKFARGQHPEIKGTTKRL